MRMNTPLEHHASKVYTRAIFDMFGQITYEASQYRVEEVEKGKTCFVRRYHPEKHEMWCRILYKVELVDDGPQVLCECGNFEHTGLLCCHAVKVIPCPMLLIKYLQSSLLNACMMKHHLCVTGTGFHRHRSHTREAYSQTLDERCMRYTASPSLIPSEG